MTRSTSFSLEEAHAVVPDSLQAMIADNRATAILVVQGTLYPKGRIHPVLIKGIDPEQKLLSLPTQFLKTGEDRFPALIGSRMAKSTGLSVGDTVTLRWRDANGHVRCPGCRDRPGDQNRRPNRRPGTGLDPPGQAPRSGRDGG